MLHLFTKPTLSKTEKIVITIERVLLKRRITAIHSESSKYAFKTNDDIWHTADFDFVNDLSGFGSINRSLLDS